VRVIPGESLGDTIGFAGAKNGRYATDEFYRRGHDRSYSLVTQVDLLNPMAPVEFFVSNDGHLATLDNWHNLGYGKVVSLYGSRGELVRSYELSDLFQADELKEFSQSVSSIHWRTGPAISGETRKLFSSPSRVAVTFFSDWRQAVTSTASTTRSCIAAEPALNQGNG